MRKVLIWSLYTYPAAPNPPTKPTSSAPASSVPVSAPAPPSPSASSSLSSVAGPGRRSLGLPLPPPPRRKGTLGEALRSVALLGSCSEESGGWKARPRCSRRRQGEAPVAGGEKWEERTGEGESCGDRCGCLMEGGVGGRQPSGSGPVVSFTVWWGVRPLERGGDKREQEVGNGKALEKRDEEGEEHVAPCGAVKGADGTNGSGSVGPLCQCDGGLSLPGASDREAPGAIPSSWSAIFVWLQFQFRKKNLIYLLRLLPSFDLIL